MPTRLPRRSLDRFASHSRHGQVERGRILWIEPRHRLEQNRAVADRLAHRPGLIERAGEGDDAPARAAAVGRLDPADPDERRGLPDRAAGVGAGNAGRDAGRDRRRRAAGRPARGQADIAAGPAPWREDWPVSACFIGRTHREFVHVELAEHARARLAEVGGNGALVARLEPLEDVASGGRVDALRREQVLDTERNARERSRRLTRIRGLGSCERIVRGLDGVGVERLRGSDGRVVALGNLARGELP